jgi:hypothetical protein
LKTHGLGPLHFIVLLPHRDSLGPIRTLKNRLFAAGFLGAFSFPAAAPLALTARPFTGEELRALAADLRKAAAVPAGSAGGDDHKDGGGKDDGGKRGKDRRGLITAGDMASCSFFSGREGSPGGTEFALYGPRLDLPVPALDGEGIRFRFPALILCAALIRRPDAHAPSNLRFALAPGFFIPPDAEADDSAACAAGLLPFSFRAAAAANMILIPLDSGEPGYSFEWKIGLPRWLPAVRRDRTQEEP